jgi:hypothetical protein
LSKTLMVIKKSRHYNSSRRTECQSGVGVLRLWIRRRRGAAIHRRPGDCAREETRDPLGVVGSVASHEFAIRHAFHECWRIPKRYSPSRHLCDGCDDRGDRRRRPPGMALASIPGGPARRRAGRKLQTPTTHFDPATTGPRCIYSVNLPIRIIQLRNIGLHT